MDLAVGTQHHGFVVNSIEPIPEIGGIAYEMKHHQSNARLLYVASNDANKTFSISFKTPPSDNTGVFHILEHSVLCGSKKFPVKEPFVNLLKGSMQTFLNAMTFPDKTMYPVASINEQDLMNLMDVYLDAVLNPNIYDKETIFQQEGWHYEVINDGNGAKSLICNGVVFNEMKGSLADPENVLYHALMSALFPDTAYGYESGGVPEEIPNLTYEDFLANHRKHYRLDNSYIFLYGDMDIDRFLCFLNEKYLIPHSVRNHNVEAPHALTIQKPIKSLGVKKKMVTSPDNSCAAVGYVIGDYSDRIRGLATDILLDALAGSNESPLKKMILEAGLADHFEAVQLDSIQQPFAMLYLRNLKRESSAEELIKVVNECATQLLQEGLDHNRIAASLARLEFNMREMEGDRGIPDGVEHAITAMQGWLYDDKEATTYLKFNDSFEFLKNALDEGYFEKLLESLFLTNDHVAQVEIIPCEHDTVNQESLRLAKISETMTEEDFASIEKQVEYLRLAQERKDTPEEIATLPHLRIDDIGNAPQFPKTTITYNGRTQYIIRDNDTRGITYAFRNYDANCLSFDEIQYLPILANALGRLDTKQHTASDLEIIKKSKLGSWKSSVEVYPVYQSDNYSLKFIIEGSSLSENAREIACITNEILCDTIFNPADEKTKEQTKEKIKHLLMQAKTNMKSVFSSWGNRFAADRLASYYSHAALLKDHCTGFEHYRFLCSLLDNYDQQADDLLSKLASISKKLFFQSACVVSFAGKDESLNAYQASAAILDNPEDEILDHALIVPEPSPRSEAFIIPSDVCYAAYGSDSLSAGIDDNGTWLVVSKALALAYLWNEVRVKGGAYGAGFSARWNNSIFTSFRDPNLDETLARYQNAGKWLAHPDISQDELEGYIISIVSTLDEPMKAKQLMKTLDNWFFASYEEATHLRRRSQVITTTLDDLEKASEFISRINETGYRCVIGSKSIIESSNLEWEIDELLNS